MFVQVITLECSYLHILCILNSFGLCELCSLNQCYKYFIIYVFSFHQTISIRTTRALSLGSGSDMNSDISKRRKKFNWVKSGIMRRKSEKKISGEQGKSSRLSNMSYDVDPLRKSSSLEVMQSSTEDQEMYLSHSTISSDGYESLRGYLWYESKLITNLKMCVFVHLYRCRYSCRYVCVDYVYM